MFLLHGQPLSTERMASNPKSTKRFRNRNLYPTTQPHHILLAYQRRQIRTPHFIILCGKLRISICIHLPIKIAQPHQEPHHHSHLHRHHAHLWPPPNDDWCDRFWNRKDTPSTKYYVQLVRMPCISTRDRIHPITHYHLQKEMAYSFRQRLSKSSFHFGIITSAR